MRRKMPTEKLKTALIDLSVDKMSCFFARNRVILAQAPQNLLFCLFFIL